MPTCDLPVDRQLIIGLDANCTLECPYGDWLAGFGMNVPPTRPHILAEYTCDELSVGWLLAKQLVPWSTWTVGSPYAHRDYGGPPSRLIDFILAPVNPHLVFVKAMRDWELDLRSDHAPVFCEFCQRKIPWRHGDLTCYHNNFSSVAAARDLPQLAECLVKAVDASRLPVSQSMRLQPSEKQELDELGRQLRLERNHERRKDMRMEIIRLKRYVARRRPVRLASTCVATVSLKPWRAVARRHMKPVTLLEGIEDVTQWSELLSLNQDEEFF